MTSFSTNGYTNGKHDLNGHVRHLVLVVDDEPSFCLAIAEILSLAGYAVNRAESVPGAIDSLHSERPDLILTDIMMPDHDGLSFLRMLNADPRWSTIPAIAVTAKALPEDRRAALEAGADGYLSKPFSAGELKRTIADFLGA